MFLGLKRAIWILAISAVSSSVYAQDVDAPSFIAAVPLERGSPVYPGIELINANSGMAEIELMIDTDGRVFAPIVLRSTATRFENAALLALKDYVYKPAMFNGESVKSRTSIRISFLIEGEAEGVNRRFSRMFKRVTNELDAAEPNLSRIDKSMVSMLAAGNLSSYALARYNLLGLRVAIAFGDLPEQIEATRKLLMFDQRVSIKNRTLNANTLKSVRYSLFHSLLSTQRYAEALELYTEMKEADQSEDPNLESMVAKIQQLRQSDAQSVIDINIGARGYSVEHLLKHSISIVDVDGTVTSLKFRCERKFKELPFSAESDYRLPKSWGGCLLEIVGEPGTVAKLVQY
jgi:TonB family protein